MPLLLAAPGQPDVTKMRWQMKIQFHVAFIAIAYLICAQALAAEQIVVYHSLKDFVAESAAERFEKEIDIRVRLMPESAQVDGEGLSDRLLAEANRPSADVLWARDPLSAAILKSQGLSAPYESPNTKNLPKVYSDPEPHWTAFPAGAVVILYNQNLLSDPEELQPPSWT